MNIQTIFQELQSASDFELFRLKIAIDKLLEDPERINNLRKKLVPNMPVEYFCHEQNKLISCTLLEIKRTKVTVQELDTAKRWTMPFHYLNLDHIATEIVANKQRGMSKAELSIGCLVGFFSPQHNQEYFGRVGKLNPKRVVILIEGAKGEERWNVPYQLLFPVINGETGDLNSNGTLLLAD